MNATIWTKRFWEAAAERAIKAAAWCAGSTLAAAGAGLIDADWVGVASASGMAGLLSLLGSVASDAATGGGPSITKAEVIPPGIDAYDGRHRR